MSNLQKKKQEKQLKRKNRTRKKIRTISKKLRLSVFRSHKHIYAQVIDDGKGITLVSASDHELKGKEAKKDLAFAVGQLIARKCLVKKIEEVSFDKGAYKYHGRVAKLAEGARQEGLKF